MNEPLAGRLTVALTKREERLKEKSVLHERIQDALVLHAEFNAQCDFDRYWLTRIDTAYLNNESRVDNHDIPDRHTDELYGWALYKLLNKELGSQFEVVEVKRFLCRSYVRISWTGGL